MSLTLTAVGTPESGNWRAKMPIWAHMRLWNLRRYAGVEMNGLKLVDFIYDEPGESGYLVFDLPDGGVGYERVSKRGY